MFHLCTLQIFLKLCFLKCYKLLSASRDSYVRLSPAAVFERGILYGVKGAVNRWLLPRACFPIFQYGLPRLLRQF